MSDKKGSASSGREFEVETEAHTEAEKPDIPEAAKRALAEAKERRQKKLSEAQSDKIREVNGRGGLDPARYGDWEKKGIAVDF